METLTAAAIATLLITKTVEKLGESIGEKIPALSAKAWDQAAKLKGLLQHKAPETAAVLTAAESAPMLMESTPDTFSLPVLAGQVEGIAAQEDEVAQVIELIAAEVRPQLPEAFQEKVVAQVMLKGVRGTSLTVGDVSQEASASATRVGQEMLTDVEVSGDINLGNLSQKG